MQRIKVIARFLDGHMMKGYTDNFNPLGRQFHLFPIDAKPADSQKAVPIKFTDLKAVFIVHDFAGKRGYRETKTFSEGDAASGAKLKITFSDGEVLVGRSLTYDRDGTGFFMFPADPNSNNQRIFVLNASVKDVSPAA